ncbi:hypothetical protein TRSC58_04353 [Trypanosoma rangeli SC58]|uniref:Phosphoribulokinase/uridine kinase domain-containing protein n=1 Tax=Trypanosoma rangeli SC58 TaxID=429131 RepID=A0A061J3R6_TRYRA|nr:hypothetical protein TRSC58_04353 [Trypanosoma rangeli SC58]
MREREEAREVEGTTSARNVVAIGVSGCSASGKTTLANRLVELLNSPLLPIGLDDFFDEDMCEMLGTWEDPRCIRTRDYARLLREIRRRLESDDRCAAECLQDVAGASSFLRSQPVGLSATNAPQDSFSDASSKKDVGKNAVPSHDAVEVAALHEGRENQGTVYIVCEGTLLFLDQAVCEAIDYFVIIEIDEDIASLRRFLRFSRHHVRCWGYGERIKRMFRCRQGCLLLTAPATNNALLSPLFEQLLPNLKYLPPLPSVMGDYERFWLQQEYLQHAPPPMPLNTDAAQHVASPYSWMVVKDPLYITHTLQQSRLVACEGMKLGFSSFYPALHQTTNSNTDTDRTSEMDRMCTLQKQYFEFRYWFFFEVLYYYRQLRPAIEEAVDKASQKRHHMNDGVSPVLRITAGMGVPDTKLDKELLSFVQRLMQPPYSDGIRATGVAHETVSI